MPGGNCVSKSNLHRDSRHTVPASERLLNAVPDENLKPSRRSSSFLQSMIDQQSYTKAQGIRKPSTEVVARLREERTTSKPRPNTTFLHSEISKGEQFSFKLTTEEESPTSLSTAASKSLREKSPIGSKVGRFDVIILITVFCDYEVCYS